MPASFLAVFILIPLLIFVITGVGLVIVCRLFLRKETSDKVLSLAKVLSVLLFLGIILKVYFEVYYV